MSSHLPVGPANLESGYSAARSEKDVHPGPSRNPIPAHHNFLPIALIGSQWHGRGSLRNLVIFGDSYSASLQEDSIEDFTWSDHVASLLAPLPPKVHNFAFPGATAEDDLTAELGCFLERFSKKSQGDSETVTLDPQSTTYVLFIGINDCGTREADDLEPIIEVIFDTVHQLYIRASARNFVFIDVPPIDQSPGGSTFAAELKDRVETWNDLLYKEAADLAPVGIQATRMKYGFTEKDVAQEGGRIWEDALHVTSDVQKVIAEQFVNAMMSNS